MLNFLTMTIIVLCTSYETFSTRSDGISLNISVKRGFTLQVINMAELRPPSRIIVEECSFFCS